MMLMGRVGGEMVVMEDYKGVVEEAFALLGWGDGVYRTNLAWRRVMHPRRNTFSWQVRVHQAAKEVGMDSERLARMAKRRYLDDRKWILAEFDRGVLGPYATGSRYRRLSDGRPTLRAWRDLRNHWQSRERQRVEARQDILRYGRVLGPEETPF